MNGNPDEELILASNSGNLPRVKHLVEDLGADVNAISGLAINRASKNKHIKVVEYLLQKGVHK
jgi:ankyrin repeat protein